MDHGVGQTLRMARKRRRIELAQVEQATKIRARFLLAIENEEWEALPGEAYVGAFIRSYAACLGLDGQRLAEQQRQEVGASRPGERLLGADPTQLAPSRARPSRQRRLAPRTVALLVSAALVAVLVAVGVFAGGDEPPLPAERGAGSQGAREGTNGSPVSVPARVPERRSGVSLRLTATAEVWVCLLDGGGEPLLDGQVLPSGAEEGPFRSGSFTVSLGNGEVSMMVNGEQASIPETPSPVAYTIGGGGELRELPEGERPTCT